MNFLKKIFSPGALIISILLLIYTFYQSEINFDGSMRNYYFIYYIISTTLVFLSVLTFFINPNIKEYLIISIITLIPSLYIFEIYLHYKEYSLTKVYEEKNNKKWDNRSRYEIYNDLKKINNNIAMTVAPILYINKNYSIFPLSGVSNSKTINCNENGYFSIYQSDRFGFNNPDKEWDSKNIEYLLVGDSYAHGACVNRPNDISSVLRTLSNKSVLNLGYGGNGPLLEYATLREYLNSNVKNILWLYYEPNDIEWLPVEMSDKILVSYLNDLNFTQDLKLKQNKINELTYNFIEKEAFKERKKINKTFSKKEIVHFIKFYKTRRFFIPEKIDPVPPEFEKILKLTKELAAKKNSNLYFVYLSSYVRNKEKYNNTNYNLVKKIINDLDINFIDIHQEVFEKKENPLLLFPFGFNGHYNVEGYKRVAETIYKFTKN